LITGLILAPVTDEFTFKAPFLSLAANAGLLVGAVFWGFGCDIWGRRYEHDSFFHPLLLAEKIFRTCLLDGVSTSLCYLLAFLVLLLVVHLILLRWRHSLHWLAWALEVRLKCKIVHLIITDERGQEIFR
jgi:MFS family permease